MKKCVHCGTKLNDKAVVCVSCGYLQPVTASESIHALAEKPKSPVVSASPTVPMVCATPSVPATPAAPAACAAPAVSTAPVGQLKTNRGLLKFIFLSILTLGIYGIVVMSAVSTDINIIAGRYDGKRTMHYCWIYFVFSWLTLGIVPLVWSHKLCSRIGNELSRRRIPYRFGAGTFWCWSILGSFIFVGPFIYIHKLLKAMNLLAANYNIHG